MIALLRASHSLAVAALMLASAAVPPAVRAQAPCAGDCNGDRAVVVNELIIAVNLALGNPSAGPCAAADLDHNGAIVVNELVAAVNQLLFGCGGTPPPLDTPTATPTLSDAATPTPTSGIICLGYAAVVNELDRSLSIVDECGGQGQVRGVAPNSGGIPLDAVPRAVTLSADGRTAYVTTRAPDRLAVVDVAQRRVIGTLDGVEAQPEAVTCTPDEHAILVANFGSDSVSIINGGALRARLAAADGAEIGAGAGLSTPVRVGSAPNALAVTADSHRAYVTNFGSRSVSVVDIDAAGVMATITVGDNPNAVAISPDGRFAYVSDFTSMMLSRIDTRTNTLMGTFPVNLTAETRPTGLAFSPSGRLFVTTFNLSFGELYGSVLVIDASTDSPQLLQRLDFRELALTGALPAAARVSANGDTAFVSNFVVEQDAMTQALRASAAGGTLLMIDTATSAVMDSMPVGTFPVSLAVAGMQVAPSPTQTSGPSPTPTAGELCGAVRCLDPSVCTRDLGCHRNGCQPRDKCCPADDPDCLACRGGSRDGAACDSGAACPSGECGR